MTTPGKYSLRVPAHEDVRIRGVIREYTDRGVIQNMTSGITIYYGSKTKLGSYYSSGLSMMYHLEVDTDDPRSAFLLIQLTPYIAQT